MRKTLLFCLIALFAITFTGCLDDDGYSLGDFVVTTATIEVKNVSPYVIVTDGGDRLFPSASAVPYFKVHDGQRVWIDYTILGDAEESGDIKHYVKVNNLAVILTKGIFELTPEKEDSIGNDPVRIKGYWFTGDYLTIRFTYGGGDGSIHYINLVQDINNPQTEEGMPILEFRHNRNNDRYNNEIWGTVSFNLSKIKVDGENSVEFVLRAKTPEDGESFEKVLTFNYEE